MRCRLNVKFNKPEWADDDLIRQHIGWDVFGVHLFCDESEVAERLENLYGLPAVASVEVMYLKEE